MNQLALMVFLVTAIIVVIVLCLCILYLVFVYRKLLDKYTQLSIRGDRNEVKKKLRTEANDFINQEKEDAIAKATEEAIALIAKNAQKVAKDIREKTINELKDEEKGEEQAVAAEFDSVKAEIEKYKTAKFDEIKKRGVEILSKVTEEALGQSLDEEKETILIIKALEDAKRSNIF